MKVICVIPARYHSTRFEGKPLADICGRPMLWWVYRQCERVEDFSGVYVATDDMRIAKVCESFGMKAIMTSAEHMTGTDRVGEAAMNLGADLIVNVQGDEPLLEPDTIKAAIRPFYADSDLQVSNLMTRIKNPIDAANHNVPKVITNRENVGVYLTRAAAPYPAGRIDFGYYKQVCVYCFRPGALGFYCSYGAKYGRAKLEGIEDIEILRFIENGFKVQYIEVETDSVAVDTPNDLERVRKIAAARLESQFPEKELFTF